MVLEFSLKLQMHNNNNDKDFNDVVYSKREGRRIPAASFLSSMKKKKRHERCCHHFCFHLSVFSVELIAIWVGF